MTWTRGRHEHGLFVAFTLIGVFAADLAIGPEISFSIFYLIPIALTTWFGSPRAGFLLSVLCALMWLAGEQLTGVTYSSSVIAWWNMLVRLGFFLIVTQALAARRRIEGELLAARGDALAANKAKSEFVNRVTHELRTPLTAILGFSDVLHKRSGPYLTPDDQECLRRIRANGESLMALVDGVLDVARVGARHTPPQFEAVDLVALVDAITTDIRGRILRPGVRLWIEKSPAIKPLHTDPALLRQILLNLVSNAAKFTESGSVILRLIANQDGEPRRVEVQDSGIGIPEDKLNSIFQPFEQADGSIHRRFGGAGLGLAIANDLCQVIGCTLEVTSRRGVGSTFSVVFPETTATSTDYGRYVNI